MNSRGDRFVLPTQGERGRAMRIDSHHHLWRFNEAEYGWIDESMDLLRRDFLLDELEKEIKAAGIDATVAVQARESVDETWWLLECARSSSFINGVVGWVPLGSDNLSALLDEFDGQTKLAGFREVVQGKPSGYLLQRSFNRDIEELGLRGFTYDVLIYEHQLVEAAHFLDRHPNQRFVVDHAAKPRIAANELEPWKKNLLELARRPNVFCKISGLVTEADWKSWTPELLAPYLDVCVEAFGPERLMAGSDWPVCLVASGYSRWWDVLRGYFADFSEDETGRIFGENAIDFYKLRGLPLI
jgi:L-fuconolactonase